MKENLEKILREILLIDQRNIFLKYIVKRLQSDKYRGWHISQHNRWRDIDDVIVVLQEIERISKTDCFAIPPGDWKRSAVLPEEFKKYQAMVRGINVKNDKGTINSVKKNFFPDLDKMGFLIREKKRNNNGRLFFLGHLSDQAVKILNAKNLIEKYKLFTDAIDRLFGSKISELAETLYLSEYSNDPISIYEFMFIFSDSSLNGSEKIELLAAYRSLRKYEQKKLIELVKKYAEPSNFSGNKTNKRDFSNWKNEVQQMMGLLKTTVYFEVEHNRFFRLNVGSTGFFQKSETRSVVPKHEYFRFHKIKRQENFELHHVVPISAARNRKEAKMIDDYRNLIYLHNVKHKEITRAGAGKVVLSIIPKMVCFSDFEGQYKIKANNDKDAFYSKDSRKIKKVLDYNISLLQSIFQYSYDYN
jgi:hypothetical protein